jgi:DamX protein
MSQSPPSSDESDTVTNHVTVSDSSQIIKKSLININTRVEHMMRFSKQAVLVVDEEKEIYSQVGTHFLASLSDNNNAAFVALSEKLDDIQIRCRVVEQLFSETLFDPEESLAVTVLKLAEDKSEVISIVVENVQFLSLQLMHEFCQLAELAVKTDRIINVLLVGEEVTGKLIAKNKDIFTNKISILSAHSGQLLKLDIPLFNDPSSFLSFARWKINTLIFTLITAVIFGLLVTLYQVDSFSFSGLSKLLTQQEINENVEPAKDVFVTDNISMHESLIAEPIDILHAINAAVAPTSVDSSQKVLHTPTSLNIQDASTYESSNTEISKADNQASAIKVAPLVKNEQGKVSVYESYQPVNDYYLNANKGFVIQIKGFVNLEQYNQFHKKNAGMNLPSFHRLYKGQVYIFVTTSIYESRELADVALVNLSPEFINTGAWIKSVAAVQNEIKQYQATTN